MAEEAGTLMSVLAGRICHQISSVFSKPTSRPPALNVVVEEIAAAAARKGQIFVYGVGREGLMLKALCMRLAHLGLRAHCVFDMTTPPICPTDLLVASAGPGGFATVDAICRVAQSNSARILLLTGQPDQGSSVAYADVVAYVPAQTMADDVNSGGGRGGEPLLPMGSLYEGALFVLFEMVVYRLAEILEESPEAIRSRHTNLE
ncbi:6-phospho-3-hexuloisomerase [Bertholletia excelsa]